VSRPVSDLTVVCLILALGALIVLMFGNDEF
jgi:hypothetical protein